MNTPPILFIIFRRPETTKRVFDAIRKARPSQLFVSADGPRPDRPDETLLCQQTREIIKQIDWPCDFKTNFYEQNQGLKRGVTGAITWFFSFVEEGIILEDDCLPHHDFFKYSALALQKFRNDARIFHIGAVNFQPQAQKRPGSWYYSRYNHVWGWATWKRSWDKYNAELTSLEDFLVEARKTKFWDSKKEEKYWSKIFRATKAGKINTWDYQWNFSMWAAGCLCVTPGVNLVENIGFGAGATNTQFLSRKDQTPAVTELGEIQENPWVLRDEIADRYTFKTKYWGSFWERSYHRIRKILSGFRSK